MKAFLLLILLIAITCQQSLPLSREEKSRRKKLMKEKLVNCLRENASKEFIAFMNENISRLRYAIGNNKESISQEDKLVIRRCKEKLSNEINLN